MKQDDALEMFVRFNSGGKALRKSEITMSILEAYWPSAKTEFGKLLVDSYAGFGSDFIIRAALMLYGDVIKSNINKQIAEELKNNWSEFKKALKNLEALLKEMKISEDLWEKLLSTYRMDSYENIWEALFLCHQLFRAVSGEVAERLHYAYPEYDRNITKYTRDMYKKYTGKTGCLDSTYAADIEERREQ